MFSSLLRPVGRADLSCFLGSLGVCLFASEPLMVQKGKHPQGECFSFRRNKNTNPSIHPSVHPSIHPFIHPSTHPSIHPAVTSDPCLIRGHRILSRHHSMSHLGGFQSGIHRHIIIIVIYPYLFFTTSRLVWLSRINYLSLTYLYPPSHDSVQTPPSTRSPRGPRASAFAAECSFASLGQLARAADLRSAPRG